MAMEWKVFWWKEFKKNRFITETAFSKNGLAA